VLQERMADPPRVRLRGPPGELGRECLAADTEGPHRDRTSVGAPERESTQESLPARAARWVGKPREPPHDRFRAKGTAEEPVHLLRRGISGHPQEADECTGPGGAFPSSSARGAVPAAKRTGRAGGHGPNPYGSPPPR